MQHRVIEACFSLTHDKFLAVVEVPDMTRAEQRFVGMKKLRYDRVAQRLERSPVQRGVAGSSPATVAITNPDHRALLLAPHLPPRQPWDIPCLSSSRRIRG